MEGRLRKSLRQLLIRMSFANAEKYLIIKSIKMDTLITIGLIAAGLVCFLLFYKSIDWFEKI